MNHSSDENRWRLITVLTHTHTHTDQQLLRWLRWIIKSRKIDRNWLIEPDFSTKNKKKHNGNKVLQVGWPKYQCWVNEIVKSKFETKQVHTNFSFKLPFFFFKKKRKSSWFDKYLWSNKLERFDVRFLARNSGCLYVFFLENMFLTYRKAST